MSLTVDGPPPKDDDSIRLPKAGGLGGPGQAKPAGRGMPAMPPMSGGPPAGLQVLLHSDHFVVLVRQFVL